MIRSGAGQEIGAGEFEFSAADLAGAERAGGAADAIDSATVVLTLRDLISDGNNEIVVLSGPGLQTLQLVTDEAVTSAGIAGSHITAAGEDVSGHHFMTFASGLTLYYEDGLSVVIIG